MTTKSQQKIRYILFSLSLVIVWAFLFLDVNRPGNLGVFIGLVYTFYGSIYFKNDETQLLRFLKYLFPFIYLITYLIISEEGFFKIISPIVIGFILLIVSDLFKKEELKPIHFILPLTYFYIYVFSIFPTWERTLIMPEERYNFEKEVIKKDSFLLNEFQFLNADFDTIKLSTDKDFIIIESWNETCIPCIKAMKELPDFYDSISTRFDQYYLYEPNKKTTDYQKVFDFKHVDDKTKIIADFNKQFYKKLGLESYPYFLIYDKKGNLVYEQLGYNEVKRELLRQAVLKL